MIRLYDTQRRDKVEFAPADPVRITMYVCGPTVYARAHIGNFRPPIIFDVLRRLIRHEYGADALVYARNITDIDDKIMQRAAETGRSIDEITAEAEGWYLEDAGALGVEPPDLAPHATDHLPEMIALMQALVDGGHAYAAEGHVLFDTTSDGDYGRLSGRQLDEMIAGARVEVAPYKKNAADFVLWKPSAADEPGWESPWGRGRPGWHTECAAMIRRHLGDTIDIHGGGQDLIFPHHENEAAQGRCVSHGAPLARLWMHNGFLSVDSEKMSKSLGNIVTVRDLLDAGHRGETIRLAMLSAHYRQPLDWTAELLAQAKATLDRWYRALEGMAEEQAEPDAEVVAALANDLNTPAATARLSALTGRPAVLKASARLLGLLGEDPEAWRKGRGSVGTLVAQEEGSDSFQAFGHVGRSEDEIEALIDERAAAKREKDFAAADRIRDDLASEGIILEDGPNGTSWRRD